VEVLGQARRPLRFRDLCLQVLEIFRLRETNIKDICVDLGRQGVICEPWRDAGPRNKPKDADLIKLESGNN
jgi:hypothetical protein